MGIELSENSGIKTPASEEVSVDSFKQVDPRTEHFSFRKLRIEQEKKKRKAEGDNEEKVDTNNKFKNFKFKHLKGFEDIAESNIEKYKKLKKLEVKNARKRMRTLSLGKKGIDKEL